LPIIILFDSIDKNDKWIGGDFLEMKENMRESKKQDDKILIKNGFLMGTFIFWIETFEPGC
jgi:hypothetical protein